MPQLVGLGIARNARVDLCVSVAPISRYKDNKIMFMPQLLELGIARHARVHVCVSVTPIFLSLIHI